MFAEGILFLSDWSSFLDSTSDRHVTPDDDDKTGGLH